MGASYVVSLRTLLIVCAARSVMGLGATRLHPGATRTRLGITSSWACVSENIQESFGPARLVLSPLYVSWFVCQNRLLFLDQLTRTSKTYPMPSSRMLESMRAR